MEALLCHLPFAICHRLVRRLLVFVQTPKIISLILSTEISSYTKWERNSCTHIFQYVWLFTRKYFHLNIYSIDIENEWWKQRRKKNEIPTRVSLLLLFLFLFPFHFSLSGVHSHCFSSLDPIICSMPFFCVLYTQQPTLISVSMYAKN